MVPDAVEATSGSTTSALIHTGLLSVGLSNLFWKGSELNQGNPESILLLAMALFCIALPFQGLYILLSRMIREYNDVVRVPEPIMKLASLCEMVSYSCGITGFCLMLMRTSMVLGAALLGSAILVILLARSAMIKAQASGQAAY
ncbi:MAG: hypothetical protein QF911_00025 [Candidatus Thalassarchaeaceae archaeon]|jgi:hypothetical protein|nr:hypothetical protein [Candidatus Thalassarchaeaceae archaeon]